jgi:hypothetical protein
MATRTRSPRATASAKPSSAAQRRKAEAQAWAATAQRAARRRIRIRWAAAAVAVAAVVTGVIVFANRGTGSSSHSTAASPAVGGDLHTVFVLGDALYVGGHDAVAVSRDTGRTFTSVPSLAGADAMGWASSGNTVLVGGHPGLFRSTDHGATFTLVTGPGAVADVHALGGAGNTLYLASPQAGLLASLDGGASWHVRNAQAGRSFMGTILIDPANPARLIAPDMSAGLSTSSDGGRTWTALGGPAGAMAVAWNPADTRQILAVGMDGGALSTDGGASWQPVTLPGGTSAVTYDPTGRTLYAGALNGQQARTYRSTDNAQSWTPTA